jgi:hypothetical protein
MKRALLAFVLFAVPAAGQETYSLPAGAGNVATLSAVITNLNGEVCVRGSLPRTCTQAQACVALSIAGGASCTAANARNGSARIYPLTQPGREEFVTFGIALPRFLELVAAQVLEDRRASCEAWLGLTQGQRDTFCTATLSLAAGCNFGCP